LATEYIDLTGKSYWAKLSSNKPDEYSGDKRWTLNLVLDEDQWEVFEESGLQLKRKSGPGGDFIQLRRPVKKLFNDTVVNFTAPVIIDEDGKWIRYFVDNNGDNVFSWDKNKSAEPKMVGKNMLITNGSTVTARVAVYDTMKGKGHRLESVQIIDMAPAEMTENQEEEAKTEPTTKTKGPKTPW